MAAESESITVDYINKEITKHHAEIENAENEIKRLEQMKKNGEALSDAVKSTEEMLIQYIFVQRMVKKMCYFCHNFAL